MENYESDLIKRHIKEKAEREHIEEIDRLNSKESFSIKLLMFLGDETLVHSLLLLNFIAIMVLFQFYFVGNFETLFYHKILALLYLVSSISFSVTVFSFLNSHVIASLFNMTALIMLENILI